MERDLGKGQKHSGRKTRLKGKGRLGKNFLGSQNGLQLPANIDNRGKITLNTSTAFGSPIKEMIFFLVYVVYAYYGAGMIEDKEN